MSGKESNRTNKVLSPIVESSEEERRDSGIGDANRSLFSDSMNPSTSLASNELDPITRLIQSIERLEQKMDKKFERMEQAMLNTKTENEIDRVKFEERLEKKFDDHKYESEIQISDIGNSLKEFTTKITHELSEFDSKIESCENHLRNEQTATYEVLKDKINENQKASIDMIQELSHQHSRTRIGFESDIRRLRQSRNGQSFQNNNSIITKQLKLPNFSGKSWEKPMNFVRELEEYLQVLDVSDDLGLKLIGQSLTNDAKDWWVARRDVISTWEDFKTRFLARYWSEETQREVKRDLVFGYYLPESKLGWSEYAGRKYAVARGLNPPLSEAEIVGNLTRHFGDAVVEGARCRNITDIDRLLEFLDQTQSGGRSNAPKTHTIPHNPNRYQNNFRQTDERNKPQSWRNGTGVPNNVNKASTSRDESNTSNSHDQRYKSNTHETARRTNFANDRHVSNLEEEFGNTDGVDTEIESSENDGALCN